MSSARAPHAMLTAAVGPTLWSMTWPVIFGAATLISFNVVDTFFISLLGTEELAAVGFTFSVSFTVVSLTIGLGIGTSAVIARKLGRNEHEQARQVGSSALYLSALLVGCLSFIFFLLTDPIFSALGATPELLPLIKQYMYIWYAGSPLLVVPMVGNSVLRASGDTKTPSFIMAAGGVLNAVLDPLLIFGLGPFPALGIQGAALATAISWLIGFVLMVYWLVWRRQLISGWPPVWRVFLRSCQRLLAIGIPAAGANMLTPLAMAVLTAVIATHGAPAVAAFGVGIRLESLASIIILALSMSLPPFISQNFGAGQMERVRQAYRLSLFSILGFQFAVYLLMLWLLPGIQHAFTREAEVADILALFIWIMPLGYGLQGWIILTNSSLNALHKPMQALSLSIIRLFVTFVPFSVFGHHLAGLPGLFIGGVVANLVTAMLAYRWFMRVSAREQQAVGQGRVV